MCDVVICGCLLILIVVVNIYFINLECLLQKIAQVQLYVCEHKYYIWTDNCVI